MANPQNPQFDSQGIINAIQGLQTLMQKNYDAITSLYTDNRSGGKGRYSGGMFGYSNTFTNKANVSELKEMLNLAREQKKSENSFSGLFFGGVNEARRNIEALKIDLKKTEDESNKTLDKLKQNLQSLGANVGNSFDDAIEAANKKLKDLDDRVKTLKDDLKSYGLKDGDEEDVLQLKDMEETLKSMKDLRDDLISKGEDTTEIDEQIKEQNIEIFNIQTKLKSKLGTNYTLLSQITNKAEELKETEDEKLGIENDTTNALNNQLEVTNKQINQAKALKSVVKEGFSEIVSGVKQIYNVGKQFAEAWMKVDTASSKFSRNIGMSKAGMEALRKNTINTIANTKMGIEYNVGMEDLIQLQQGYTSLIGRNIGITSNDQENMAAMNAVLGDKGGQLASNLENFGLSYSDAAKRAGKMFKEASEYGLSFEKYSDNFLQNIKLAQNYTFKNGLKGLESMAKKATAIKLDMQQIASFAEKVGTLQGAVETSAQLQVLGGPFARFSDPLGMLNESMTDMEGLMDRFTNMVGNLGRFNSQTGQVEVSAFNKQRIKTAAQAMGMGYEQVMESVQAQGRRNYIENQLKVGNRGFSDKEAEFIKNTATIQNGNAVISYLDAKGNRVEKDVNSISKGELNIARQQNQSQSDDIKDIAKDTRDMAGMLTGYQKRRDAVMAQAFEHVQQPVKSVINAIDDNVKAIVGITKTIAIGVGVIAAIKGVGTVAGALPQYFGLVKGGGKIGTPTPPGSSVSSSVSMGALNRAKFGRGIKQGWTQATKGGSFISKGGTIGKAGQVAGRMAKGAAVGGLLAEGIGQGGKLIINNINESNIEKGKYTKNSNEDFNHRTGANAFSKAGHFAAVGSTIGAIGGPVGMAIGAGLGALLGAGVGLYQGNKEKKEFEKQQQEEAIARMNGYPLTTNSVKSQLESGEFDLESGNFVINSATFEESIPRIRKANGGLLNGPSHSKGGMKVQGSNIEVEGGEFIVNKKSTAKNLDLLTQINSQNNNSSIIKPRIAENGGMLTVVPTSGVRSGSDGVKTTTKVDPITLNINGTIKLEGGNGQNVDITKELTRNPVFIRELTKLIEKQITINTKGGNVVNKGLM